MRDLLHIIKERTSKTSLDAIIEDIGGIDGCEEYLETLTALKERARGIANAFS